MIDETSVDKFKQTVWAFYAKQGRYDLPWRLLQPNGRINAYHVLLSEIMLQQTQVNRVLPKFNAFINTFKTIGDLSEADQADVVRMWSGLGYNRRAMYLHQSAKLITNNFHARLPQSRADLIALPGIGQNTAGAILAYAYNQPELFIETNIRTVFIQHFFANEDDISDQCILEKVAQSMDLNNPREWYWALMDYGTYLKQAGPNPNRKSASYLRQAPFKGSKREIRGKVLKLLNDRPLNFELLENTIVDARLHEVVRDLSKEGLIKRNGSTLTL